MDFTQNLNKELDSISVAQSAICHIEECQNLIPDTNRSIKVITQNIRSIHSNMANFQTLLVRSGVSWDIIVLTECWLTRNSNIPILDGYKSFSTSKHQTQNEGVVIYCKISDSATSEEPEFTDANILSLKICSDTIIIAIYRPPSHRNVDNFLNSLDKCLRSYASYKNIILVGDINIDITPNSSDHRASFYLDLIASHGMLPGHSIPTHSRTCLDHIILKTRNSAYCYVAHTSITDHDSVILFLDTKSAKQHKSSYKRINHKDLCETMKSIDFSSILNMTDVNEATNFLSDTLSHAININTTIITMTTRRKTTLKPWITPGLLRCMRNRDNLYVKTKKYPDNEIILCTYKRYRNFCNNLLKKIKTNYEKDQIKNAGKNTKKLWEAIREITHTTKKKDNSTELICNDDPTNSANMVNTFFANVGKRLAEKNISKHHSSNIQNTTNSSTAFHKSIAMLPTDEQEVKSLILDLKNESATGVDNISGLFLKQFLDIIVPPLTYICNLSFKTGIFPTAFKKSQIVPIFKNGDRCCVNNYRPISILPAMSKILEKLMNARLVNFLETNQLLSPSQFGFRSKKSTADAVHQLTEFLISNLDNNQKTLAIYLDLAKAFDTVSIPILINKLDHLGIRGVPLQLFTDYLSGRTQVVKLHGTTSDELPIEYGVPQGSILGPTLFLVYINNLCDTKLTNGKIITFADDTALLFHGKTWNEVYTHAQTGFNYVSNWLSDNILTLNVDKTKYMAYTLRSQAEPNLHITAHSCASPQDDSCNCPYLSETECIKYLGVLIDKRLTFKQHIDSLVPRIRKLIYIFKSLRHIADTKILKSVYFSLCQSLLSYCITSWGGAAKTFLLNLERAQRAVLKVACSLPIRFPSYDLYQRCQVLTVRQIFLLLTIIKKHMQISPNIKMTTDARNRKTATICMVSRFKNSHSQKFYPFLGSYLYNKTNKLLSISQLSKANCKKQVTLWLQSLDYNSTESLLKPIR